MNKTYTFEPGKNSPLPPIPTYEKSLDTDKLENDPAEEPVKNIENPNEFILSPEKEKRLSVNIAEKKLLQEAIEEEQTKMDNQNIDKGGISSVLVNILHSISKVLKMKKRKFSKMRK